VLHDIFTEILVLDAYKDDKRICKLYDYGVSEEHYWVIMRFYRCSLKEWRLRQTRPFADNLMLYLNIFSRVLETMKICIKGDKFKINHFDLKCDNVLIDPIDPNIEEVRHTHSLSLSLSSSSLRVRCVAARPRERLT
jgi:serine/threonine protein kinase